MLPSGGTINNDTEGHGWFVGAATGVLPWRGPIIGFRAAAINNALIDGGDNLDVNLTQINGSAVSTTAAQLGVNVVTFGTAVVTGGDVVELITTANNNIGTPVALDGGAATIGGMLTKMADNNGGADFDASTDSLEKQAALASANNVNIVEIRDDYLGNATYGLASIQNDVVSTPDLTIEGSLTWKQTQRIILSAVAGKSTGQGTTSPAYRDYADAKDRIAATVDADGNRTAVTLDGTD